MLLKKSVPAKEALSNHSSSYTEGGELFRQRNCLGFRLDQNLAWQPSYCEVCYCLLILSFAAGKMSRKTLFPVVVETIDSALNLL